MRLRRSDLAGPGWTRRRRGKGFSYLDESGAVIRDADELDRIRALAIPPAWRDVWIAPYAHGHIQAVGTDDAGRRQYLYHPAWREQRDREKFDHVLEVARRLPRLRRRVRADLRRRGLVRERVLAAAVRLIDLGLFRVGGDEYAGGDEPTYGVATLRPEHVTSRRGCVEIAYPAKGGVEQRRTVTDPQVCAVVRALARGRAGDARLLAFRERDGRWREVHSGDVNDYLREATGADMTAKDFRTWHATVYAAAALARARGPADGGAPSATAGRRMVAATVREVAELLGNTPAVARSSYVDPRIVDLFHEGVTVPPASVDFPPGPGLEAAVLDTLDECSPGSQGS
ncbi:MAG: DNA topoisomerase IB [Hamadaea sp.]|nr:DNA topoisomerase IB [Hamadaea sp.]